MCVAVIIRDKSRIPKDNIKAMHEANPHGGGIAWYGDGDIVHYRKGMSWEEIDAIQDQLPRPFLMHFRIATKGGKIPELTHPFPIGMQAFTEDLVGIADKGVIIHNGTWSDYHKYIPNGINIADVSDTQVAAYVAAFDPTILDEVKWSNAIMTAAGIKYRGQWQEYEGNLYSNLGWKRTYQYTWDEEGPYAHFYGARSRTFTPTSRTTTPIQTRKKGLLAHQQGHNQSNGRTQNQYQTQFNKAGQGITPKTGRGSNTVQSNGKTIQENRAEKAKAKLKDKPANSNYDKARESYKSTLGLNGNEERIGSWKGERLFDDTEIPGYKFNVDKYIGGPSVKCDDCHQEIVVIPCPCSVAKTVDISELELEAALIELEELEAIPENIEMEVTAQIAMPGLDDVLHPSDLADVEDLNAYGMSAGMDGMPEEHGPRCGCGCEGEPDAPDKTYLDPDWKEIQDAIARDGIKVWGE
jgi:hypothetical protein